MILKKQISSIAFIAIMLISLSCSDTKTVHIPGWDSFSGDKAIEQKVDSVLSLMTLDEKIG